MLETIGFSSDNLLVIVVGVLLLFFGRKLFWLAVAAVGFYLGGMLAKTYFGGASAEVVFGISVLTAIASGILARLLQKIAFAVVGFAVSGYFVSTLSLDWGLVAQQYDWLAFLIGGSIGAVLVTVLFESGLIIMTALLGSELVLSSFAPGDKSHTFLLFALAAIGSLVQFGLLRKLSARRKSTQED